MFGSGPELRFCFEAKTRERWKVSSMKKFSLLIVLVLLIAWFDNVAAATARTIHDLPGLPVTVLKHELPKDTYAKLSRQPV